jgi:hypothetical protein
MIDERMLRVYKFLVSMNRLTLEQVPEPYRSVLQSET